MLSLVQLAMRLLLTELLGLVSLVVGVVLRAMLLEGLRMMVLWLVRH